MKFFSRATRKKLRAAALRQGRASRRRREVFMLALKPDSNGIIKLPLQNGRYAIIDKVDLQRVAKYTWHAYQARGIFYAQTNARGKDGKYHTLSMHRYLLRARGSQHVDHKDCDGLNNRRNNIRIATRAENARNSRTRKDNRLGLKGVTFRKDAQKFAARIRVNGKMHCLGHHKTAEAAHAAYCKAAAKLHGEFARTK